jgi:hypothetical protein
MLPRNNSQQWVWPFAMKMLETHALNCKDIVIIKGNTGNVGKT